MQTIPEVLGNKITMKLIIAIGLFGLKLMTGRLAQKYSLSLYMYTM